MPRKPLTDKEIQNRLEALERKGMQTGGNVLGNYTGNIPLPGGGSLNMDILNKQIASATKTTPNDTERALSEFESGEAKSLMLMRTNQIKKY